MSSELVTTESKSGQLFRDPAEMQEIKLGMSNLFKTIDEGFEEALRAKPNEVYGRHAAWNFNGLVWFDGSQFIEQVWVYRSIRSLKYEETLEKLMTSVCEEFGYE